MFDDDDKHRLWFKLAMNVFFASKSKSVARKYREHMEEADRAASAMANKD